MGHVLTAERSADLQDMVEQALEGAGYSVAALVESNLTVELLESKSNPVVVLLNKQTSQCILVDVLTQSHPVPSLPTAHVSSVWRQSGQPLRSLAVDRYSGIELKGGVFATRAIGSGAWSSPSRLGSQPVPQAHQSEYGARRARHIWVALMVLTHAQVRVKVAIVHLIVLALLGCFSGLFLRSWWSLMVVPAAYLYGVALTFLGNSSGTFEP